MSQIQPASSVHRVTLNPRVVTAGVPMGCDICYTNHAEADREKVKAICKKLPVYGA